MSELFLSIVLGVTVLALLFFIFKREREKNKDIRYVVEEIGDFMVENNKIAAQNLSAYLKHIQQLEKIVIEEKKPKPAKIDDAYLKEVLSRGPELVENEISKADEDQGIEINETNFKNIPFGANTNIQFEGDPPPIIDE